MQRENIGLQLKLNCSCLVSNIRTIPEVHLRPRQTSKMELFVKIGITNDFHKKASS